MTQGVTNQRALGHYCSCIHPSTDNKTQQPLSTAPFNKSVSLAASLDVVKKVINNLSAYQSEKKTTTPAPTSSIVDSTANNSIISPDKEALDGFIISLIEQLLATLERLLGDGSQQGNTKANNHSATNLHSNNEAISANLSSPSTNNFYGGKVTLKSEEKEQHFEAQLYALIEFMNGVNDNLEEISNDRVSGLIGYLEQEYEEKKYQNRRDNMVASLMLFLEEYRK